MSGRGKRVFTAKDLRALSRGKIVTVIRPGEQRARLTIPKMRRSGRRP